MTLLDILGTAAFYAPFLMIVAIFGFSHLRRSVVKLSGRRPSVPGSVVAMGIGLRQLEVFYRPSMAYVLEAQEDDSVDEDDTGEPETPQVHFHRQLRRIRRGEQVDQLEFRLRL